MYGEIKGDGVQGTLEEIQYKGLILNAYSGTYVLGVLIMEGDMTSFLRDRLRFFVDLFEQRYGEVLKNWSGCVDDFDAEWIVSNLHSALNYGLALPHTVPSSRKLRGRDATVIKVISEHLDSRGEFYIKDVLRPVANALKTAEEEALDVLIDMHERGVIQPIGVSTILTRQGLGLPGEEGDTWAGTVTDTCERPPEASEIKSTEEEEADEVEKTSEADTTEAKDEAEQFIEEVERLLRENGGTTDEGESSEE